MIATTTRASAAGTRYQPVSGRSAVIWAFLDAMVLAKRSLLQTLRVPELIVFVTIQPVMFVLLFRYVFGGAIHVPGGQYVNFLMPGIFVQTVAFGGVTTGIGLAEDMQRGLIDRFRTLPMSSRRSARRHSRRSRWYRSAWDCSRRTSPSCWRSVLRLAFARAARFSSSCSRCWS